jgi:hypothetical protein
LPMLYVPSVGVTALWAAAMCGLDC